MTAISLLVRNAHIINIIEQKTKRMITNNNGNVQLKRILNQMLKDLLSIIRLCTLPSNYLLFWNIFQAFFIDFSSKIKISDVLKN